MSRTLPPPRKRELRANSAHPFELPPTNPVAVIDAVAGVSPNPAAPVSDDPFANDAVARGRRDDLVARHKPRNVEQLSVIERIAKTVSLLRRCWRNLEIARERDAQRARLRWDEDRTAEAEELAGRLRRSPGRTLALLMKTLHGARLLISIWNDLAARLEAGVDWTPPQRLLALDLLGVDPAFRDERSPVDRPGADAETLRKLRLDLVRSNVHRIELRVSGGLLECDKYDRRLRSEGQLTELDPLVRRLAAEEKSLSARLSRLETRLEKLRAAAPEPSADDLARAALLGDGTATVGTTPPPLRPASMEPPPLAAPAPAQTPTPTPTPAESEPTLPPAERIELIRMLLERDNLRRFMSPGDRAEGEKLLANLQAELAAEKAPPS